MIYSQCDLKSQEGGIMTNGKLLKDRIDNSGISITFLSEKLDCSRNRIYSIIEGKDCTASEIVKFTELLHLDKKSRDEIFLPKSVN